MHSTWRRAGSWSWSFDVERTSITEVFFHSLVYWSLLFVLPEICDLFEKSPKLSYSSFFYIYFRSNDCCFVFSSTTNTRIAFLPIRFDWWMVEIVLYLAVSERDKKKLFLNKILDRNLIKLFSYFFMRLQFG